jgi:hypothetical protein
VLVAAAPELAITPEQLLEPEDLAVAAGVRIISPTPQVLEVLAAAAAATFHQATMAELAATADLVAAAAEWA